MGEDGFTGRRAAVTGAGGLIGGALARRLVAEGAVVVGIDLAPAAAAALADHGIEAVTCDVTNREALERAFAGSDYVFHTAAHVHEWGAMEEFIRVKVGGTASVLDAAATAGVSRVVHVSSVVVYGYDAEGEQDESAQLRSYGIPLHRHQVRVGPAGAPPRRRRRPPRRRLRAGLDPVAGPAPAARRGRRAVGPWRRRRPDAQWAREAGIVQLRSTERASR